MTVALFARETFDGSRWLGPSRIVMTGAVIDVLESAQQPQTGDRIVECIVPGLTDFAVVATGYSEGSSPEPFGPEHAFELLCLRHGITTVVDLASSLPVLTYLERADFLGLTVVHGGGRITERASTRNDLIVNVKSVDRVLTAHLEQGHNLLAVGLVDDPSILESIAEHSLKHRVPLVFAARTAQHEIPGSIWPLATSVPSDAALGFNADDCGAIVCPQLEASARWTIEGMIDAPEAWLAAPFLPYARHFRSGGGRIGRRLARGVLERIYGVRNGADLGTARSRSALDALASRRCLAGSGAGSPGLVPGLSLWAEMQRLADLCGDESAALHAATGVGASIGIPGLGLLTKGARADLLVLSRHPIVGGRFDVTTLLEVVVSGVVRRTDDLSLELSEITERALVEAR